MIRKIFKRSNKKGKLDEFIKKYNIPREYLSINRKSITKGLAIGIFWGLIPMPFQMVAVVLTTPFIKFNVPIAISMVWLSNPITMPFMYYFEYKTGTFLLGMHSLHVELSIEWFKQNIEEIFVPLYIGTLFYCITLPTLAYFVVDWLWIHSVKKEKRHQKRKDNRAKNSTKFL